MFRLKVATTLTTIFLANTAFAGHETIKPHQADSLGKCVKAALSTHEGKIVKLEMKLESKKPIYELDIESDDGTTWDVECDIKSGKITEIEQEVKLEDVKFKALAKVSESDAKATALTAHPGDRKSVV